ncbi:MAG: ketol-acid reductoisomerase [bacterium]
MYSPPYKTYDTPPLIGPNGPVERIGIIGYGNQGRAQALNLRDSGLPVVIGLRDGSPSIARVVNDGLEYENIGKVSAESTAILLLVPDEFHKEVVHDVLKYAKKGSLLVLAHGVSIHFGRWEPREDMDCGLIAPHSPGIETRRLFEEGSGVPAILAEVRNATGRCRERIETLAAALGCARKGAGVRWGSVKDEVETDLFVEQALLVGGVIELIRAVVATMVRAGYDPAICRMATLYELPHIAVLYDDMGPVQALKAISPTAAYGAATRGPRIIDEFTRKALLDILNEIQSGAFEEELHDPGSPLVLKNYIDRLESSHLAQANAPFKNRVNKSGEENEA